MSLTQHQKDLQKFLYHRVLPKFIPDRDGVEVTKQERYLMISVDAMKKFWGPAFTHVTFSSSNNYETLETYGDKVLNVAFGRFLQEAYPTLSSLNFTEFITYYASNEYIATRSRELDFPKYLQIGGVGVIEAVEADVFEAFIGALTQVGDLIGPGLGNVYAYNFIIYLFKDVKLDMMRGYGGLKTQLTQLLQRLGQGAPTVDIQKHGRETTVKIYLNRSQITFFQRWGKKIDVTGMTRDGQLKIGEHTARSKEVAQTKAYDKAFEFLYSFGISTPWGESIQNQLNWNDPEIKPYLTKVLERAGSQGFISVKFPNPNKKSSTDDQYTMMLVGIRENGAQENLLVRVYEKGSESGLSEEHRRSRIDLAKAYAEGATQ